MTQMKVLSFVLSLIFMESGIKVFESQRQQVYYGENIQIKGIKHEVYYGENTQIKGIKHEVYYGENTQIKGIKHGVRWEDQSELERSIDQSKVRLVCEKKGNGSNEIVEKIVHSSNVLPITLETVISSNLLQVPLKFSSSGNRSTTSIQKMNSAGRSSLLDNLWQTLENRFQKFFHSFSEIEFQIGDICLLLAVFVMVMYCRKISGNSEEVVESVRLRDTKIAFLKEMRNQYEKENNRLRTDVQEIINAMEEKEKVITGYVNKINTCTAFIQCSKKENLKLRFEISKLVKELRQYQCEDDEKSSCEIASEEGNTSSFQMQIQSDQSIPKSLESPIPSKRLRQQTSDLRNQENTRRNIPSNKVILKAYRTPTGFREKRIIRR